MTSLSCFIEVLVISLYSVSILFVSPAAKKRKRAILFLPMPELISSYQSNTLMIVMKLTESNH